MKKIRRLKGFTLIELLVVIVILGIVMAGIMAIIKPIRTVYVDSTLRESQRTTQNGIAQYLTESIRFANDIYIYNSDTMDISTMISDFQTKTGMNELTPKYEKTRTEIIKIDNATTFSFKNKNDLTGRLIRKESGIAAGVNSLDYGATDTGRIALGEAYYGLGNYTIKIESVDTSTVPNKIKFLISSLPVVGEPVIKTQAEVTIRNTHGEVKGKVDTTYFDPARSTTIPTYIFFVLPEATEPE